MKITNNIFVFDRDTTASHGDLILTPLDHMNNKIIKRTLTKKKWALKSGFKHV